MTALFQSTEAGSTPLLVKMLDSQDLRLKDQAVWALGNLAGDGPVLRDALVNEGALPPLLKMVHTTKTVSEENDSNIY